MKEEIVKMYEQALIDNLAPHVFADQVLRLFSVSSSLLSATEPICNKNGTGSYCSKCGDTAKCSHR